MTVESTPYVTAHATSYAFKYDDAYHIISASDSYALSWQKDFFWEIFGAWTASKPIIRQIIWSLHIAFNVIMVILLFLILYSIINNVS